SISRQHAMICMVLEKDSSIRFRLTFVGAGTAIATTQPIDAIRFLSASPRGACFRMMSDSNPFASALHVSLNAGPGILGRNGQLSIAASQWRHRLRAIASVSLV